MALLADTKDESYEDFMGILGIETKGIGVPMGAVPLSFPETSVEARIEEIFVAHKNSRRRRNRGTKVSSQATSGTHLTEIACVKFIFRCLDANGLVSGGQAAV